MTTRREHPVLIPIEALSTPLSAFGDVSALEYVTVVGSQDYVLGTLRRMYGPHDCLQGPTVRALVEALNEYTFCRHVGAPCAADCGQIARDALKSFEAGGSG